MTFQILAPWVPIDDLMAMPLKGRIAYVRTNLKTKRKASPQAHLSHDDFAEAVGYKNRQGPINWEKGRRPRENYAKKIAALTPYPEAAFGARGEEELAQESFGRRLLAVEDEARWLRSQLIRLAAASGLELEPQVDQSVARADGVPL